MVLELEQWVLSRVERPARQAREVARRPTNHELPPGGLHQGPQEPGA